MKKNIGILLAIIFVSGFMFSCENAKKPASDETGVKNIIFLIGDGMGVPQLHAAMEHADETLIMEKAEYTGLSKTHSLTNKITDSAAGGTALATGNKTSNGVISQDTLGNPLKTILEFAEDYGLSTGLVSTSAITHATPASFIAHEENRNNYEAIAADFLDTDIEVFIGGGFDHFANRKDGLNLVESLEEKGYSLVRNLEELKASQADKLAGLLAEGHLPPVAEGREDMLSVATAKALDILSRNEDGFFLMVEGSQIDWGGHANDLDYIVSETIDFDQAVGVAVDFAKKNPGTLVVVTSDHETGGLAMPVTNPHFAIGG
ncbi:MAG: alkaline phosphatase, partial [Bacteroidota bacterium]